MSLSFGDLTREKTKRNISMDYLKQFNKLLIDVDYSKSTVQKFSDFLSLTTYSMANAFYRSDEIEEKYLNVAKNYTKAQHDKFSEMFIVVIDALEDMHDFLGKVFSTNDMGSSYKGQFFTPYHVSKMMAEISATDLEDKIRNKKVLTLSEPCSGSGGMVIAFAQTMKEKGYNYQNKLFVEAIDIDDMCFKMTYIQLCLLGIPARVIKGNSLSLEYQEVLYTSMFFINGWDYRLNSILSEETETLKDEDIDEKYNTEGLETVQAEIEPVIRIDREQIQLNLFGE